MKTTVDAHQLEREFGNRVIAIGEIWPFLDSYSEPSYTTRLWCLFELFTAMKKRCTIEVLFSLSSRENLFKEIRHPGGYAGVTEAWKVNSATAKASVEKDRDFIREIIQTNVFGGFEELDLRITEAFKTLLDALGVCRSRRSMGHGEPSTSRPPSHLPALEAADGMSAASSGNASSDTSIGKNTHDNRSNASDGATSRDVTPTGRTRLPQMLRDDRTPGRPTATESESKRGLFSGTSSAASEVW